MAAAPQTILIIGAGIVGSALANFLSSSSIKRKVTIIDRSFTPLLGSTGHAPGFVGQFNDSEVLTHLAINTVAEYHKIPGGFDTVGGLEIAFKPDGIERLRTRCANAKKLGLSAEMISLQKAAELAPHLVDTTSSGEAVLFKSDGTANAGRITSFYQEKAKQAGVDLVQGHVKKLILSEGSIKGIEVEGESSTFKLEADKVVLTTGIWAQDLSKDLDFPVPVVPVGHPYMHGKTREPIFSKAPFVRWPEHHVYARDHGTQYGLGTYDHRPVHYKPSNGTAIGDWIHDFQAALDSALTFLPSKTREEFVSAKRFNGIFSMTPDNMPLAGSVPSVQGLYMAVAVWVTSAAGTAKFLGELIDGSEVEARTRVALDPERFRGSKFSDLEKESLDGYNNIYKTAEAI